MKDTANPILHPPLWSSRYYGLVKLRQAMQFLLQQHFPRQASPQRTTLAVDIGCGSKPYQALLDGHVSRYLGADLPSNPAADLLMDPRNGTVPIESGAVDLVLATQVLEHVDSPRSLLKETFRITRQDGLLMLSTHGLWPYHPHPNDYWRWTGPGLRKLLQEEGWEVRDFVGILSPAAASMNILQDAVSTKLPRPLQGLFTYGMQRVIGMLDALRGSPNNEDMAAVFLLVAGKTKRAPCTS